MYILRSLQVTHAYHVMLVRLLISLLYFVQLLALALKLPLRSADPRGQILTVHFHLRLGDRIGHPSQAMIHH